MSDGPFELEARNREFAKAIAPGCLVTWSKVKIWIEPTIRLIDDVFYDRDHTVDHWLSSEGACMVVACTSQCFVGRPSNRAHYVITPHVMGWYTGDPDRLSVTHAVEET